MNDPLTGRRNQSVRSQMPFPPIQERLSSEIPPTAALSSRPPSDGKASFTAWAPRSTVLKNDSETTFPPKQAAFSNRTPSMPIARNRDKSRLIRDALPPLAKSDCLTPEAIPGKGRTLPTRIHDIPTPRWTMSNPALRLHPLGPRPTVFTLPSVWLVICFIR